ncbi:MAG TPA: hypothetical protein VGN89_16200, partial [Phenylobacterium sp.]|nr:hypothetical protein [Phenylobacterium sp.]
MTKAGPAGDRRPWPRAPISLQLVILLMASLLVAQAISFGIVFFIPPPRPPVYRVADVAAAIRGGSLKARFGRPMIRTTTRTLPPELVAPHREHERTLAALAQALSAPEARVRLEEENASPIWRLRRVLTGEGPPRRPDRGGPMGGSPFEMDRDQQRGPGDPPAFRVSGPGDPSPGGPRAGWWRFSATGPELPIFGDFAAALQQDDGTWTVVRSKPDTFPNDWQMQASGWLLAGFLLVASAGYLFSRRISAPLRRFAEAAETLGRDPHAPQMTLKGPAEVGAAA